MPSEHGISRGPWVNTSSSGSELYEIHSFIEVVKVGSVLELPSVKPLYIDHHMTHTHICIPDIVCVCQGCVCIYICIYIYMCVHVIYM